MRDISFQQESFLDTYQEAIPLIQKHYEEIAHYKDIELAPDIDMYHKLEMAGTIKVYTSRRKGQLVGYAVFFVRYNLHYKKSLQAMQDVIYIDPKHRGFGALFISWCDEQLKKDGIQVVYHHVKASQDFSKILTRLGYHLIDYIYGRRLDK